MPDSEKNASAVKLREKVAEKERLKAETAFDRSAAEVINLRLDQIGTLSQGLLDLSDTRPAAEMYLATRRMRVALGVFKPVFPKAQYRNGREETRVLAEAVAVRHRLDISISTMRSVSVEMGDEDAAAVEVLIRDLEKRRSEANRELGRVVHGRRMHAYRIRIEDLVNSAVGPDVDLPDRYRPMRNVPPSVTRLVSKRLRKLRQNTPAALDPAGTREQRRMGVAAEMLRYTLELTGDALGTQADTARRAARGLQRSLGEMSDCERMLPEVRERIAILESADAAVIVERARGARVLDPILVQAAPNRNSYRGLEMLSVHLQARQTMVFESFRRLWQEQSRQGVWVALENSLKK